MPLDYRTYFGAPGLDPRLRSVAMNKSYLNDWLAPGLTAEEIEGQVAQKEIRAALNLLCNSKALSGSEKLIRFLTFVVETTIRGDSIHLKETVIGMSVFGRAPDYDPKADTIVRSQAWRLRFKLKEYYESEGASQPLQIVLRKGSYIPIFVRRGDDTIASMPFRRTG